MARPERNDRQVEGSYGGQGWRSTPQNPFRLRTLGTWGVAGQEGSRPDTADCSAHYFDVRNGVVVQSFYSQGTRFLDVRDPTNPRQIAYYRPDDTRGIDILKPTF